MDIRLDWGLSEQETALIGSIMVEWSAIEYEVFQQTLLTFECAAEVPRQLRSPNFTNILDLWKERVADTSAEYPEKLNEVYSSIMHFKDYRNALAHGMWFWDPGNVKRITSTRFKKDQILQVHFSNEDLQHFREQAMKINFDLRYPGGKDDYIMSIAKSGGFISRRLLMECMNHNAEQDSAHQSTTAP